LPGAHADNYLLAFFDAFLSRHPSFAPFSTPTYSNAAFTILKFALENITGNSLSDLLTSELIEPICLNSSSYAQPASSEMSIVPFNASVSGYNLNLFDLAPTGGYYSSLNDLTKLGRSILNSTFLTPAMTRKWMKPATFTSNANYTVGAPWEILRAPGDRVSHLYSKSGGLGMYAAEFVLMPDYDVGFSVLAAGSASLLSVNRLSDLISESFYPALEAAAKAEADYNYAGTFHDPSGINSSITVITDDRPGLGLRQWIFNGSDITSALIAQLLPTLLDPPEGVEIVTRLYPTGLQTTKNGLITRTAFRAGFGTPGPQGSGFSSTCLSWFIVDGFNYGGIGFDEFVFNLGCDGRAVSVEPRILQQTPLQAGSKIGQGGKAPCAAGCGCTVQLGFDINTD
jgi:Beta-lactamase